MRCYIYRSGKKADTYLYLPSLWDECDLPTELTDLFGQPQLAMELELHPERQLAREDISQVLDNLRTRGYHLQLPPPEEGLRR